jgi:hypothetical protein
MRSAAGMRLSISGDMSVSLVMLFVRASRPPSSTDTRLRRRYTPRRARSRSGSVSASFLALLRPRAFPSSLREIPCCALKKFPVPLRREFGCKPLNCLWSQPPKPHRRSSLREIPCSFPCYLAGNGTFLASSPVSEFNGLRAEFRRQPEQGMKLLPHRSGECSTGQAGPGEARRPPGTRR